MTEIGGFNDRAIMQIPYVYSFIVSIWSKEQEGIIDKLISIMHYIVFLRINT